jgi:hypothetical protein
MLCAVLSSVFASHRGGDGLPCMLVCIVLSGRSPACARVRRGRVRAGPVFRALGVSLFGTDSTLSYRKSVMYRCVMVKIEFLSACAVFAHGAAGAGVGPGMWK